MFMRAAVIEWEEDVEREQVRLEERCKAVAAAVKEHGVDGAVEIFPVSLRAERRSRKDGSGGDRGGVARVPSGKPRANPCRWRRRRDDADSSLARY